MSRSSLITVGGFSVMWASSKLSSMTAFSVCIILEPAWQAERGGKRGNAVRQMWNHVEHLIPDPDSVRGTQCTCVCPKGGTMFAQQGVKWTVVTDIWNSVTAGESALISHFELTCCCAGPQWHRTGTPLVNEIWESQCLAGQPQITSTAVAAGWFLGQRESSPLTLPNEHPESRSPRSGSAKKKQNYCPCLQMNIAGSKGSSSSDRRACFVHVGFGDRNRKWSRLSSSSRSQWRAQLWVFLPAQTQLGSLKASQLYRRVRSITAVPDF